MNSMLTRTVVFVAAVLALGACTLDQPKTAAAPARKAPAADYQAPVSPAPNVPNRAAICYNDADLAIIRARMIQGQMAVAALQCQNPGGGRALEGAYGSFLGKFNADLTANGRSLQQLAGRKRFNVDVLVTEFANRTAQRAPVDPEFCSRSLRALEWGLSPQVTSLSQVPPAYDLGPDMNIHQCAPC